MAIKQLPKRYHPDFRLPNKKPVGDVEIDWSNPLTQGLVNYFKIGGVDYARDLVAGGSNAIIENAVPTISPTSITTAGSTDSVVDLPINLSSPDGMGIIAGGRKISGVVSLSIMKRDIGTWTGVYLSGLTRCTTSNNNSFDGTVAPIAGSFPLEYNNLHVAYSLSTNDLRGSVRGGGVTQDTAFSMPAFNPSFASLGASRRSITDNESVTEFLYVGIYNRALTDSELIQLSSNPYQILKPKQAPSYSTIDASGGIVISPTSIPSGESFGTPTITTGGVLISPVAIPTQESVGSPTILKELFISPVTIPSEEAVGDPVIELILQQIFPNGIPTEEFVGRPIVLGGDSIVIPVLSRQTWNAVAKYLRDLVFKGHDNDVIVAWLRSEGFEDGAYNDLWYEYLLQKGFIDGSLTDKYAAWRQDIAGDDPWILSSGSWNDNKIWRDNENWKDS